jgi:hypothetical protein
MDIYKIMVLDLLLFTIVIIVFAMTVYFMNMKQQEILLKSKINDLEYLVKKRTINDNAITLEQQLIDVNRNTSTNNDVTHVVDKIPINIHTRGHPKNYTIIGVLNNSANQKILPLYGRQVHNGSSKWSYYTSSDGYNTLNLSIVYNNKDCWNEHGCDEIFSNDVVNVIGYDGEFKVNLYKNTGPTYIPYIN